MTTNRRFAGGNIQCNTASFQRIVCFLLYMLFFGLTAFAQAPLQVITKIVEKEIPYTENIPVRLTAQKADILIRGWNRPTISIKLRLIAKHSERTIAERELTYHQYALQVTGDQIDLSNRFVIPQQAGKLRSQLKAIYEINLPTKAHLTVTNTFGDTHLTHLNGTVSVDFEFGKLTLDDITGKLTVNSEYGDVDGRNLSAILTMKTDKAEVTLRDLSGTVRLQTDYGKLTLLPALNLTALTVESTRTDILLAVRSLPDYHLSIISFAADIRIADAFADQIIRQKNKLIFGYQPPGSKPNIQIIDHYAPITIQVSEKPLVNR